MHYSCVTKVSHSCPTNHPVGSYNIHIHNKPSYDYQSKLDFRRRKYTLPPDGFKSATPKRYRYAVEVMPGPQLQEHKTASASLKAASPSSPSPLIKQPRASPQIQPLSTSNTPLPSPNRTGSISRVVLVVSPSSSAIPAAWTVVDLKSDEILCNCFTYKDGGIDKDSAEHSTTTSTKICQGQLFLFQHH